MKKADVAIYKTEKYYYPDNGEFFRPSTKYPEIVFEELATKENHVYDEVRNALFLYGFDEENFGTDKWNPFGSLIDQNSKVLIKPNLVMDHNRSGEGEECLYTHASVIAPVIDYVVKAQRGEGQIIVGDAPMQECDFDKLVQESGLKALVEFYKNKGINIQLVDFRDVKSSVSYGVHKQEESALSNGVIVDLGKNSEFAGAENDTIDRFRITNYDPRELAQHHNVEKHEYCISKYLLEADVIINMPKPKTHRKAGVTISMKNIVGINARKEYLPHHTMGSVKQGGDECNTRNFCRDISDKLYDFKNIKEAEGKYFLARPAFVMAYFLKKISNFIHNEPGEGSWSGNHTISRTINDLNKILIYADKNGHMCDEPQRKMLIVADMIISGEKEGPVMPSRKELGVVAVGENAYAFDSIIATLMGMDASRIPTLQSAKNVLRFGTSIVKNPTAISNDPEYCGTLDKFKGKKNWDFVTSKGWESIKYNNSR